MHHRSNTKLGPKYFGPFQVLDKVGLVAYKLNLLDYAHVHPTMYASTD